MSSRTHRARAVLGVPLTWQAVAVLLAACLIASLTGLAVMDWLEHHP